MKRFRLVVFFVLLTLLALSLMAFIAEPDPETAKVIAGIISTIIILFGPTPLKLLYDWLKIPEGTWRVIATYVVALLLSLIALAVTGQITGFPTNIDEVLALGGVLLAAVTYAYHRLKDLQRLPG